jgi:hypothetical protein
VLDHSLVPFLGRTVYWRKLDTKSEALNYAALGFHISVLRGLAGGCKEDATTVAERILAGKITATCQGLGREDIRSLWTDAADKYLAAYKAAKAGKPIMTVVKPMLDVASVAADVGYKGDSVASGTIIAPPRDPERPEGPSELPTATSTRTPIAMIQRRPLLFAAGALGIFALGGIIGTAAIMRNSKTAARRKHYRHYFYAR